MLEVIREIQLHRDPARRTLGKVGEHRLVMGFAVAEEHVLGVEGEVARVAEDEIQSLLRDEPRREGKDGRLPATEAGDALKRDAAALLS